MPIESSVGGEKALARLREASDRLLALLAEHRGDAWTRRPASGAWSAADHAEHVIASNAQFVRVLSRGLRPLPPGTTRIDDAAIPVLLEREVAPEQRTLLAATDPTGTLTDSEAALAAMGASVETLLRAADGRSSAELRGVGAPHPIFGPLDGVQWLLFAAAHTEQHRGQIAAARLAGSGDVS